MSKYTPLAAIKDFKNPHKLHNNYLDALIHYFSQVDEVDAERVRRLLRFIIDGTDGDVLLELAGRPSIGKWLRLHQSFLAANDNAYKLTQKKNKEREKFLWPESQVAGDVWMRVGQVFESLFLAGGIKTATLTDWPGWLCTLAGLVLMSRENNTSAGYWTVQKWEVQLQRAEVNADALVPLLLDPNQTTQLNNLKSTFATFYYYGENVIEKAGGWPEYLARHVATVRALLQSGDAALRTHALRMLMKVNFNFTPIHDLLVEIACGNAKNAREVALMALAKDAAAVRPLLEKTLSEGDTGQRHEAASALWRLYGAEARSTLDAHAQQESSDRVKQTITKLIAAPTEAPDAPASMELPPLNLPLGEVPLGENARTALRDLIVKTQEEHTRQYQQQLAEYEKADPKSHRWKPHKPAETTAKMVDEFMQFVESGKKRAVVNGMWRNKPMDDWFAPPDVQLIHVVRIAYGFQFLNKHNHGLHWNPTIDLETYRNRSKSSFGLRELAAAIATLDGIKVTDVLLHYLSHNTKYWGFCNWEPEAIWPAFAVHLEILRSALGPSPNRGANYRNYDYSFGTRRDNAFRVLAMFPQLPSEFIPMLWDLALGDAKSDRLAAQDALASVPGKTAKVLVGLEDGKQTVRAAAADWLGRLGDAGAIEPLKDAFRKEKQEVVKGAIMAALDALGANVEEFLDRKQLLKEAEAGLAKKKPKAMDWFPIDSMPELHWQDTGKRVDKAILQWWAVQSVAQKTPIAGPLLRRYFQMCRPSEAAALSRWVLRAWIGADTEPLSHDDAAARAKKETDQQWQYGQQNQYMKDYYQQKYQGNKDNMYQEFFNKYRNDCKGSAIGEKGILAMASAAGDAECVKLAEQYIRKWFGQRLAQCKALIEVLAWLEHPTAIQVLLSIGNRFRTKSIRDAAAEHVKALAERQGWTLDELADRTLPDAGFERETDDDGKPIGDDAKLILDYGERTFTVKLNDDLEPVITTAEGKSIKTPPAPGKSDDPEKAKEAKKRFSDAKKTVKTVVKTQSERMYEAMCTQRSWRFDDWQRYLARHPIVGQLCTRVVWAYFDAGDEPKLRGCFRPMEDGTLTNEKDEPVEVSADAVVRVAHTCNVTPELEATWKHHLEDYDIAPLFAQFGMPVYDLPAAQKKDTEIKTFEGHMLSNFKLRGKATKLGYIRGQAEDGGWFHLYRKPFVSLEIEAILNFTGSPLPEEDRPVGLISLAFQRLKQDGGEMGYYDNATLALEKVPPVLLSECYNDIKQIAAEGSGFDAEWNKKAYY
jgi:hypothetical protein